MAHISRLKTAEIADDNLIEASDLNAEFDQLVNSANTQDDSISQILTGNYTQTGNVVLQNALSASTIAESVNNTGVTADGVLLKDSYVKVGSTGYTPAADGEFGYDSTSKTYKGRSNGSILNFGVGNITSVVAKSADYTTASTDIGVLFKYTGSHTLTITQIANWFTYVKNNGTGEVTVNTGSGTIDLVSSIILMPGETILVISDGTNADTVGRTRSWGLLDTKTASASASIAFTSLIDGTYTHYAILGDKVKMGTNGAAMWIQVTEDGTNWKTASTDYCYSLEGSFSSTSQVLGSAAAAQMVMSTSGTSVPNGFPSATAAILEVHFYSPASTTEPKNFKWENSYFSVQPHNYKGMGQYLGTNNAIVGVRLIPSTGNIASGTFDLYGLRRA